MNDVSVLPWAAVSAPGLLSWRMQRNFAEHLIALLYLSGHGLVIGTVWCIGIPLVGGYITSYTAAWAASVVALIAVLRS